MTEQHNRAGQRLGNYLLERLLGRGAFAEVYLGSHVHLKRQVAIKILHAYLPEKAIAAFHREAEVVAALDHPHIVRVYDFDVQQGSPFLVMDYLPNGTLRQLHPKGEKVPLSLVVSTIKQLAGALQYAHDRRLIHRDVKPENMLLGQDTKVILSDFGIAAIAHTTSSMTSQTFAGTAPYMAPEQIQAQPLPASDQYALAVVAYEWLAGERPFEGSSTEIFAKHLFAPPPPLQQKLPTLPEQVEQVIMIALAKAPEERFPNIEAFARALESASQALPGWFDPAPLGSSSFSSRPIPPQPSLAPPAPQPEPSLPHSATKLPPGEPAPRPLFIPSGRYAASPAMYHGHIGPRTVDIGDEGLSTHTDPEHHFYIGAVEWSPGGTHIASADERKEVHVWHADGGTIVILKAQAPMVWSPDGMYLACASIDGDPNVGVWNAAGGFVTFIYHGHTDPTERWASHVTCHPVNAMAWSPDGTRIASSYSGMTSSSPALIHVWDAKDGGNVVIHIGHPKTVNTVAWSPDGSRVASASNDGTVHVWNAATGRNVCIYYRHSPNRVDAVAWSPDGSRIASSSGQEGKVHVWHAADASPVGTVSLDPPVSPTQIVSGGVHRWNAAKGTVITLNQRGRYHSFSPVAWSPDGTQIVSLSQGQLHMWNATNGNKLIQCPCGWGVAWSPDGIRCTSGTTEGTIQVLSAPVLVPPIDFHPPNQDVSRSPFWAALQEPNCNMRYLSEPCEMRHLWNTLASPAL